ncbi:response regulator [Massilia endophytica]|uniref:response regulator n=1 Tax=Massilia endophytica TaxID=2899220 RepID=UPI001E575426|nr:response regulator [Massilia endophytica]UGQ47221.1 response regulator [Massilia endophytica]
MNTDKTSACRVLLAEDTEMNRTLVRILLTRLGCKVDEVVNGKQAVDALEHQRYDLVLMDCNMPVMDGFEATRLLRQREAERGLPRVPVIALTASAFAGDRERCLSGGMDDFMNKPLQVEEFMEMVQRYLHRPD